MVFEDFPKCRHIKENKIENLVKNTTWIFFWDVKSICIFWVQKWQGLLWTALYLKKNRLAGFFPIHKYGGQAQDCGEIQKEDGIQPLEAMLYTLDEINKNENILPGIRLGAIGNEKSLNF